MAVKYRKAFWPTIVLMAVSGSALLLVSARSRSVAPRVRHHSLPSAHASEKPSIVLASPDKSPELQPGEQLIAAQPEAAVLADDQSDKEQVEVEVITVRPNGFDPREITRPQGPFMLAINNRSGTTELALQLTRVQGNRIHEVRLPKGRIRWNKVVDLPPGDYVLTEQNHPNWICHLKLTAR
jgi:hypothetical protein